MQTETKAKKIPLEVILPNGERMQQGKQTADAVPVLEKPKLVLMQEHDNLRVTEVKTQVVTDGKTAVASVTEKKEIFTSVQAVQEQRQIERELFKLEVIRAGKESVPFIVGALKLTAIVAVINVFRVLFMLAEPAAAAAADAVAVVVTYFIYALGIFIGVCLLVLALKRERRGTSTYEDTDSQNIPTTHTRQTNNIVQIFNGNDSDAQALINQK